LNVRLSIPSAQEAFLRAIVAQPEDDGVRLVYADWLEEHGDAEQAAFIRASIQLHTLSLDDPRRVTLAAQLQETSKARGSQWLAAVGVPSAENLEPKFHRGCVEGVECQSLKPLFNAAETLFTYFPVWELIFWWQASWGLSAWTLPQLAEMPGLDRLRKMRLANYGTEIEPPGLSEAAWGPFFRCPRLSGLRFLGVDACMLRDADVATLADAPPLAGLTTLTLEQNRFSMAGVWAVLRSPYLTGLRRLALGGNNVGQDAEGYQALREALERRFPGQKPFDLFIDWEWFKI
jgi:uncharacterized protein (TIGR02996 family)